MKQKKLIHWTETIKLFYVCPQTCLALKCHERTNLVKDKSQHYLLLYFNRSNIFHVVLFVTFLKEEKDSMIVSIFPIYIIIQLFFISSLISILLIQKETFFPVCTPQKILIQNHIKAKSPGHSTRIKIWISTNHILSCQHCGSPVKWKEPNILLGLLWNCANITWSQRHRKVW